MSDDYGTDQGPIDWLPNGGMRLTMGPEDIIEIRAVTIGQLRRAFEVEAELNLKYPLPEQKEGEQFRDPDSAWRYAEWWHAMLQEFGFGRPLENLPAWMAQGVVKTSAIRHWTTVPLGSLAPLVAMIRTEPEPTTDGATPNGAPPAATPTAGTPAAGATPG